MELKFKPKFWKDIQSVKGDKQIMSALGRIFSQVEKAGTIEDISNCKVLQKFDSRYRIKLYLDKKRDYRIEYTCIKTPFGLQGFYIEERYMRRIGEIDLIPFVS